MIEKQLQFVFIIASVCTFIYVLNTIRKHKLNINDSIIWILWSLLLLAISIFPFLGINIASMIGFQSTSNFILSLFVFFIYIIVFYQGIQISILKEKNKELVQKCSLYVYEFEKNRKKRNEEK